MKVLAFEDTVDIEALLISGGVDTSQIEIKQFWDSNNFLNRISEFNPDVLMLDHFMPPTKGLEVLRTLLKSEIVRPKVIVAMSSASMANKAMLKEGANYGIVKFKISELEIWN